MKKSIKIVIVLLSFLAVSISYSQAKKPTIMVIPSDVWFTKNGYMMEFDNQGATVRVPDFKRAFQENSDLLLVISKINGLMAERGFPLKNMESVLKTLESESAENAMMTSKTGSSVSESPIDKLKKVAKADIIMQLTWTLNTEGPKKSVTFILQGLDAYTDKQIAYASGTGTPSFSADLPVLLEESVLAHIDNFNNSLQTHFEDMFENGREILVRIKKWDSWSGDFEKEYGGKELGVIIEEWITENTVKGRFSTTDSTEDMILFEQVRIPLYNSSGKATDAKGWLRGLQDYLKNEPFLITNKLTIKGLSQATLILGEK